MLSKKDSIPGLLTILVSTLLSLTFTTVDILKSGPDLNDILLKLKWLQTVSNVGDTFFCKEADFQTKIAEVIEKLEN